MAEGTITKMTKSQIVGELAEKTGLTKRQITEALEALSGIATRELKRKAKKGEKGNVQFTIPDLVTIRIREVEATKNKKFRNPANGEIFFRDVPASRKLRATPIKKLKEATGSR